MGGTGIRGLWTEAVARMAMVAAGLVFVLRAFCACCGGSERVG